MQLAALNLSNVCTDCLKNICLQLKNESCEAETMTTRTAIFAGLGGLVLVTLITSVTCCILVQRYRDAESDYSLVVADRDQHEAQAHQSLQHSLHHSPQSLPSAPAQMSSPARLTNQQELPKVPHYFRNLTYSSKPRVKDLEVNTLATDIADNPSKETTATDMAFTVPDSMLADSGPARKPAVHNRPRGANKPNKKTGPSKVSKKDGKKTTSRFKFMDLKR